MQTKQVFFSIKIPIWDELESDDYKLTRSRLTDSTTIASALMKEATYTGKLSDNYAAKVIVPRDKADYFDAALKNFSFAEGISL